MFNREKTYPFTKETLEYFNMSKGRRFIYKLDKALGEIDLGNPKNQRVFTAVVVGVAILLSASPVSASSGNPFDSIGYKFLGYARAAGYWICLLKAIAIIIKAAIDEDIFSCWKKVVGYLIAFGSLYYLPQIFDAVKF